MAPFAGLRKGVFAAFARTLRTFSRRPMALRTHEREGWWRALPEESETTSAMAWIGCCLVFFQWRVVENMDALDPLGAGSLTSKPIYEGGSGHISHVTSPELHMQHS